HAGPVQLDDFQRALREMQQVGRAVERIPARVAFDEILELAPSRLERAADLAADEVERMRREIVHLDLGRHRHAHPDRLRACVLAGRAARGSAPTAAGSASSTGSARAASTAAPPRAALSTLAPAVSSAGANPLRGSRSCDAGSQSVGLAAAAAF